MLSCLCRPLDGSRYCRGLPRPFRATSGSSERGQAAINTFVPWLSSQGLIVTDVAGLLHAADPPVAVDRDEALAVLGARYRAGCRPCDATDLAKWSGLPITQARRALEAAGAQPDLDAWTANAPPPPSVARCLRHADARSPNPRAVRCCH